ncbi:MAG: hypothetical protein WCJ35_07315 [Planctomycetota bacterium]
MKQLYYTSCREGESVNGRSGFQIRAISRDVDSDRVRAALRFAGYSLPEGTQGSEEVVSTSPVRLILVDTPDAGKLICHSVYVGKDPTTGRFGNFFSHLLLEVPSEIDASRAIASWGSDGWQRADIRSGSVLPDLSDLPVGDTLNDAELGSFLTSDENRAMFSFVLTAHLCSAAEERIFVAARPEDAALCVYGMTRTLPTGLLKTLSFSTFENQPLSCYSRLVATHWNETHPMSAIDLPSSCYSDGAAGYNIYSGRHTTLPRTCEYVEFAIEALVSGNRDDLDRLLAICEKYRVESAEHLEIVFRFHHQPQSASAEELLQALGRAEFQPLLLDRPELVQRIVATALDDVTYRNVELPKALAKVPAEGELRTHMADVVLENALAALSSGDAARVCCAVEEVLPKIATTQRKSGWHRVVDDVHRLNLKEDLRIQLAPRLLKAGAINGEVQRRKWLASTSGRLRVWLDSDIEESQKDFICTSCLDAEGDVTEEFAGALSSTEQLSRAVDVMVWAVEHGRTPDLAAYLFRGVLLQTSSPEEFFARIMERRNQLPEALFRECLKAALERGRLDMMKLILLQGAELALQIRDSDDVERLTRGVLRGLSDQALAEPKLRAFLAAVSKRSDVDPDLAETLKAWLSLGSFWEKTALDATSFKAVAAALAANPPNRDELSCRVVDRLVRLYLKQGEASDVQTVVEIGLYLLGPHFAGGAPALYRLLCCKFQAERRFWNCTGLLHALLAVALGAAEHRKLADELDEELILDARNLARDLGRYGRTTVFAAIERRVKRWPERPRRLWRFFDEFVRPRRLAVIHGFGSLFRVFVSRSPKAWPDDEIIAAKLCEKFVQPGLLDWLEEKVENHRAPEADAYRSILVYCKKRNAFWKHAEVIEVFLRLGLGGGISAGLAAKLGTDLYGDALGLAKELAAKGGTRRYEQVNALAMKWPAAVKRRWQLFADFLRPSLWKMMLENLLVLILASTLASIVWIFLNHRLVLR